MSTPGVDMSDYDQLGCLHDLFIRQAQKTPGKVAVVDCDGSQITYEELDKMSDLLANKLHRLGLGKNKVGGILMERSLEYTVAYLGILKAGGAYLPIEVSWPKTLLDSVLNDVNPSVICTKEALSARITHSGIPFILLEGDWLQQLRHEQKDIPVKSPVKSSLDDIAYVVYSSGTTGKPKGIQCPHRGAVFSFTWRHRAYPYNEHDREACNVFFVWEMLRPLAQGIPMYIIPDDTIYDPPKLAEFILRNKITRMLFTPSLLQASLEYKGIDLQGSLKSLRQIVYCGEVLTTVLRNKVANFLPWIQQLNLYSISECHDVSNADLSDPQLDLSSRQFCPVGRLLTGVQVVVLDQDLNIKLVGEPGEIYVGGPGLAIGYLNRPDLNKAKFIARPAHVSPSVGDRLYRTGDWGYLLSDGSLEVCGRCDTMVKIRGYTVELEAVKTNLMDLPGILSACIQAFGPEGEDKTLVAFVTPHENVTLSNRELRLQLKKRLPFYMIPSRFIIMDSIPVVEATGKLDQKALLDVYSKLKEQAGMLEVSKVVDGQEQPITPTELKIAQIWSELLNLYVLDTDESYFDVGGHSLLAAALTSKLNELFGVNISIASIFKHPTISAQAFLITNSSCMTTEKIDLQGELKKLLIHYNGIDLNVRSFWQTVYLNPNKFSKGTVLLTGATGYVGCSLLQQLLLHTQATVYCLVRESPHRSPLERIMQAREQFGLRKFVPTERVIPLKGDVSLTLLGLSKDVYNSLCLDVDAVIHAAAQVNLILPFNALYNTNVLGTRNVLLFSAKSKIKPVHYISTNGVFPSGLQDVKENVDMNQFCDQLETGYGQTKWLAEQQVLAAIEKGLPVAIYRCGNVGGSRLVGGWNPADFNLYMLSGVLKTGFAPDIKWQIELTPVDFVSQVITQLVCNLHESVGKIFHLVNNNTLPCQNLWELFRNLGYNVTTIKYNEWKALILKEREKDTQLFQLSQLLENLVKEETYFSSDNTYSQENLTDVLKKMNISYPQVSSELFTWYIESLSSVGILPQAEIDRNIVKPYGNLKGKVIVVTGASSGIGEGIGRTLARAGARVVLAARRLDRLQTIVDSLRKSGAEATAVQLDVCNAEQVSTCMQEIESRVGPIDVLVNNAGVMFYQFMKNCDLVRWQHMVNVNINGTLNCLAAVLRGMVARGSGHIVNITSDGARKSFPGLAVYCGTKYFVHCLSRALRSELASLGVKVTDVQPGDVSSELHNHVSEPEAELEFDWSTKVPILKPSDVGEAVLYALSQPSYCAINEILLEPEQLPL